MATVLRRTRSRAKGNNVVSNTRPPSLSVRHYKDWEAAARFLNVAADAYDGAIHVVPDFPGPDGEGPPLAKTRPHDMVSFHHVNLGVAHLHGAREAATEMQDMEKAE